MEDNQKPEATLPAPRAFSRFLEKVDGGDAERLISRLQHELITAMRDESFRLGGTKTKGSMTISLRYDVEKDTVGVKYDVSIKKPKPATAGSVFFIDKTNNLSREAPKQIGLPLREVAGNGQVHEATGGKSVVQEA